MNYFVVFLFLYSFQGFAQPYRYPEPDVSAPNEEDDSPDPNALTTTPLPDQAQVFPVFRFGWGKGTVPSVDRQQEPVTEYLFSSDNEITLKIYLKSLPVYWGSGFGFFYPTTGALKKGEPTLHYYLKPKVFLHLNLVAQNNFFSYIEPSVEFKYSASRYTSSSLSQMGGVVGVSVPMELRNVFSKSNFFLSGRLFSEISVPGMRYSVTGAVSEKRGVLLPVFASSGDCQEYEVGAELGTIIFPLSQQDRSSIKAGYVFQKITYRKFKAITLYESERSDESASRSVIYLSWSNRI